MALNLNLRCFFNLLTQRKITWSELVKIGSFGYPLATNTRLINDEDFFIRTDRVDFLSQIEESCFERCFLLTGLSSATDAKVFEDVIYKG